MRERRDVFEVAELQPRYTCSKCHGELTLKILATQEARAENREQPPEVAVNDLCLFCAADLKKVRAAIPQSQLHAADDGIRVGVKEAIAAYQTFYRLVVDHNLPIKLVAERQRAGKPEPQEPKG